MRIQLSNALTINVIQHILIFESFQENSISDFLFMEL